MNDTHEFWSNNQHLERHRYELEKIIPQFLMGLLDEIHLNDRGTYAHSIEAGATMLHVLRYLQKTDPDITDEEVRIAVTGAVLHDLGKILDGDIITYINEPRDLNDDERAVVDVHASLGYDCLMVFAEDDSLTEDERYFVKQIAGFALYHHKPEACNDQSIRPYVELLYLIDRGLGWTDINRAYQRAKDTLLTPREAIAIVVREMKEIEDRLVIDLRFVEASATKEMVSVRDGRKIVTIDR